MRKSIYQITSRLDRRNKEQGTAACPVYEGGVRMMDKRKKIILAGAVLLAAGIVFAIAAAFLVAGLMIVIVEQPEMSVLAVFGGWILWFGWHTKDQLHLNDDVEEDEVFRQGAAAYFDEAA